MGATTPLVRYFAGSEVLTLPISEYRRWLTDYRFGEARWGMRAPESTNDDDIVFEIVLNKPPHIAIRFDEAPLS